MPVTLQRPDGQTIDVDLTKIDAADKALIDGEIKAGKLKVVGSQPYKADREPTWMDRLGTAGVNAATGALAGSAGGPMGALAGGVIGGGLGALFPNTQPEEYAADIAGAAVGGGLSKLALKGVPLAKTGLRALLGGAAQGVGANAATATKELGGAMRQERTPAPANMFINPGTPMGALTYGLPFAGGLLGEVANARKIANHPAQKSISLVRDTLGESNFPGQLESRSSQTAAEVAGVLGDRAKNDPRKLVEQTIAKNKAALNAVEERISAKKEEFTTATGLKRMALRGQIDDLREQADTLYQKEQNLASGLMSNKGVITSQNAEKNIERGIESQTLKAAQNENRGNIALMQAERSKLLREMRGAKRMTTSDSVIERQNGERGILEIETRLDEIDDAIGGMRKSNADKATEISDLAKGKTEDVLKMKTPVTPSTVERMEMEAQKATTSEQLDGVERKLAALQKKSSETNTVMKDALQFQTAKDAAEASRLRLDIAAKQKQLADAPIVENRVRQLFDTADPESFLTRLVSDKTSADDYRLLLREFSDNPRAQDQIRQSVLQKVFEGSYDPGTGTLKGIDKFWNSEPGKLSAFGEDKLAALFPGNEQVVPKFKELVRAIQSSSKAGIGGFIDRHLGHFMYLLPYSLAFASPLGTATKVAAASPFFAAVAWSKLIDKTMKDPKLYEEMLNFARTGVGGIQATQFPRLASFLKDESIKMSGRELQHMQEITRQTAMRLEKEAVSQQQASPAQESPQASAVGQ